MRNLTVAMTALLVASACSSSDGTSHRTPADLATSFPPSESGAARLFEQYGKSGSGEATVKVGKPGAGKLLAMRIDCVGNGQVVVQVGNVSIGADCPQDDNRGALGRIGAQDLEGENPLTVTPEGSDVTWSVAVDLLPPAS